MGNYAGTQRPGTGLKPVEGKALEQFWAMESDDEFRRRRVREALRGLGSSRQHVADSSEQPMPRLVQPEDPTIDTVEFSTRAELRQMVRAETALVRRVRSWLDPEGSRLRAWSIPVDGVVLRVDLYDTKTDLLIEAKAAATRNFLRQAIGQLIDYGRYLSPRPRLAVLVPEEPTADLAALLREIDIAIIWAAGDRFTDSVGGSLVQR